MFGVTVSVDTRASAASQAGELSIPVSHGCNVATTPLRRQLFGIDKPGVNYFDQRYSDPTPVRDAFSTFTNAQGGSAQTTGVFPVHMHFTAGDWRLAAIGGATENYSGLAATPDTQDAVGKGWLALNSTTGGAS